MTKAANVKSIEAIHHFHAAVVVFQEEARLCVSDLEMQLLRILGWLEQDRPGFWKREIENCYRDAGEAKVRLHQCRMRKVGDFRPSCIEEKKAFEKAKKDLEFAQKQIGVVKYWNAHAQHEANEYHGRASQLTQMIEREIPRLIALLAQTTERLEAYNAVQVPGFDPPTPDAASSQKQSPETDPATNTETETQVDTPVTEPELDS